MTGAAGCCGGGPGNLEKSGSNAAAPTIENAVIDGCRNRFSWLEIVDAGRATRWAGYKFSDPQPGARLV